MTKILQECTDHDFTVSIKELSERYNISTRTLQRYFEATTSISSKQALQIIRIRKAVEHVTTSPDTLTSALMVITILAMTALF